MATKKQLKEYSYNKMWEVFGEESDFHQEYSMMSEAIANKDVTTESEVDEFADLYLETYMENLWIGCERPKAIDEKVFTKAMKKVK